MSKEKKAAKKAAKAEKKANKTPMDVNVKATLIRCICAVICVIIVLVSVSNGVTTITDTNLKIATMSSSQSGEGEAEGGEEAPDGGDVTPDGGDVAPDGGDVVPDGDATTPTNGGDTTPSNDQPATPANSGTQAQKPGAKTTAEILSIYNAATKKVEAAKVPFSKDRTTIEKKYDAGIALRTSKSIVYKFMGIGDGNKFAKEITKEDADSYFKYFKASSLSAADITKATLTEKGGNYTITINLKNGSSSVKDGKVVSSGNSALDKSGVSCGDKDKDYWDHKTAANVYSAVSEVPGCSSANIDESYSGAVITAVINASTGNLVSLTAKFDIHYDLSNVMASKGVAEATSTVNMKNFKW